VDKGEFSTINIFKSASDDPSHEAWKPGEGTESAITKTFLNSDEAKKWVSIQINALKTKLDHWRSIQPIPPISLLKSARVNRLYQVVATLTLGVYLYYLIYRLIYTINPNAFTFSLLFYYAELHGFIALFLYFFQMWKPIQRKAPFPCQDLSVDVFITTYNEEIHLVRKTAMGCVGMRYPHRTYILDDGNRPELAQIAQEIGCNYIARENGKHAKAGNLNNALQLTNADFVAIFDADYVPQPDFLEKTLGYFRDEKVAFVQTPHNYYNVDSFQFKLNLEKRKMWNEQDVFYRLMMPGRDYWGSCFFVGTGAVFRRKALEEIGGFATGTITEDLHTTIRLYSKGWRGIYHNEILASGLAAKDVKSYHLQKLRWAEGNISLIFHDNPLFMKGLTLPQRICFFATIFGWTIGFPKLIYFTTPSVMLLTGWYPILHFDWPFIIRYLIFLTTVILGFKIVSRGYGKIKADEEYNMLNFFILIRAVLRNIIRHKPRFIVTEKEIQKPPAILGISPQLLIVLLSFAALTWGLLKLYYGISQDFKGIGIASFWAIVNGALAFSVLGNVTAPYYKRRDFRFLDAIPVQYRLIHGNNS